MEYFASGTPVLMYRLQGIPEEYYSYCYTIKGFSVDEFKESLINVLSIDEQERLALGKKAKEFILTEKTANLQVKRILKFLQN
jgi:glycosyltransferase involved in cell wall biosynthesis